MQLTPMQVGGYCWRVGFRGTGLTTAVAVCEAESAGRTDATNITGNSPPSEDRGLFQINNYYHKEVSDSVAFSALGNTTAAFQISNHGTDWKPWSTYNSGAYKSHWGTAVTVGLKIPSSTVLARFLKEGIGGTDVSALQLDLGVVVDGYFGPITRNAVTNLQKAHRITADGIVGPTTAQFLTGFIWCP